jgi:hypothetical protein
MLCLILSVLRSGIIGEDMTDSIEAIVCEIISDILFEGLYCVAVL